MVATIEKLVPDTSVIIEGLVSLKIEKKELKVNQIIIHEAVLAELEHQANQGKAIGFIGMDELDELRALAEKGIFNLQFAGQRPKASEIKYASLGEIDALIRNLAWEEEATLLTADKIQARIATARGINNILIPKEEGIRKLKLESFFDNTTMSVHLRENIPPTAKKGRPGKWDFIQLTKKALKQEDIKDISREIVEEARLRADGFIEIERAGSTIVQLGKYRIVITKPPFSDGWEITAVRPVKRLSLDDYKISEKLKQRIAEQAEGILIAGSPGMGKCLPADEIIYSQNMTPCKTESIFNSNNNIIYSINKDGRFVEDKIISKHKRKETKLHILKTRTNRKIKVTPEHPLLIFKENKISWKPAKDIKLNDSIAVLKKIRTIEDDSLDILKYYDPGKTLCYIYGVNKIIPIYYKFFKIQRKLLKLIYFKKSCTVKEACNYFKRAMSVVQKNLNALKERGIIYKNGSRFYLKNKKHSIKDGGFLLLKDITHLNIDKNKIKKISDFKDNSPKLNFISVPKKITPSLCRFLGYIYAEGGGEKLSFTNLNKNLTKDFKECAKNVFGITEWKKYNLTSYVDWKASIEPLLNGWGYPIKKKKKSRIMVLPKFLLRCSLDNLKNFLEAYFDCDGGIDKGSRVIEYYTSSFTAAKQLSLLLMRFAIYSSFHKKFSKGANRYTIKIFDKDSIIKFSHIICSPASEKYNDVLLCKEKKYSQTLCYNIKPLINKFHDKKSFKLKKSLSIEKCDYLLNELYKLYYKFSSKNENLLILLKEYIDRLDHIRRVFDENKQKLKYSILRKNHIDHNCLKHWEKGRKIKISTLNKVAKVLGCGINVSPKKIAYIIKETINQQHISISEIATENSINAGTLQLRLINGWNTNINELNNIYCALYNKFIQKKKEIEYSIKILEILFKKDILFDKVIQNRIETGNFDVYDFETKNHNFICGELPLMVHNSTFAQALAEYYAEKGKIVKTVEAPRDLVLKENVTQYAISHGSPQEIHDILLLSRPDNTIFDEMRNTADFQLFADLRLAGIGLAGVVHATSPIDAIQRFVGRIDLGVIPQVVDTVIFIKNGTIEKVLSLQMVVKVPAGMTEADLARPVVVVTDFETKALEFELYSYGEETVVVPVKPELTKKTGAQKLAAERIESEFLDIAGRAKVEMISENKAKVYVPKSKIARIIGKGGENIEQLEKRLGISIDIDELSDTSTTEKQSLEFSSEINKKGVAFYLSPSYSNQDVDIFVGEDYLLSAKVGKKGVIRINKKNKIGKILIDAINTGEKIEVRL